MDEDAQRHALLRALRSRGIDVLSAQEAGLTEVDDAQHLTFATQEGRVLFSHNVGDFYGLHRQWLSTERNHAGIVLARQQAFTVGETTRRLLRLIAARSAEQMQNQLEFLSNW